MSTAVLDPPAADDGDRPSRFNVPVRRFVKSRTPVLSIPGPSGVALGRRRIRQREA